MQKRSKLTSLASILSVSAIILSIASITIFTKNSCENKKDSTSIVVSLVAVCATLIVGVQIFNVVEYRHVIDKFEEKHDDAIGKLKEEHNSAIKDFKTKHDDAINQINSLQKDKEKTINELKRSNVDLVKYDGDSSRMVAFLLCDAGMPTWAIGWTCRAMKRYSDCFEKDKNNDILSPSYVDLKDQCIPIIEQCIRKFVQIVEKAKDETKEKLSTKEVIIKIVNEDNHEKGNLVVIRALKDLVDYRIMNNKPDSIFKEDTEQKKLISAYISLIQKTLTPKDLKECERISWFRNENGRFTEELSRHKRDDSIDDLFKELHSMC
jgi:hypothetical protein